MLVKDIKKMQDQDQLFMSCKITPIYLLQFTYNNRGANVLASLCLWSEFILSIIFALAPLYHQYPPSRDPVKLSDKPWNSFSSPPHWPSLPHLLLLHMMWVFFIHCSLFTHRYGWGYMFDTWCVLFDQPVPNVPTSYYMLAFHSLPYSHHNMHTIPFLYNSPYFHRVQQPPVKGVVSSQIRDVVLAPLPPLHSPNKLPRR